MAMIKNRGKGSWLVQISGGYGPDGKQIRINRTIKVNPEWTESSQRKQVEREAAALETDYRRHLITEAKKIKFSEVADEFLEFHEMEDSTKSWYIGCLKRINPALGNMAVQDITPRDIRAFYKKLANTPALTARSKSGKLSGTYRLQHHRALSAILSFAVKSQYISVNPIQAVDPPRADTEETPIFEEKEIAALLEVLENYPEPMWAALFLLELFSSCRPGEIIGLNWSDLDGNVLHIRAGSKRSEGKTIRKPNPKTKASKRPIILPDEVIAALKKWRTLQSERKLLIGSCWPEESKDAMFTGDEGYRLDLSSPTQKWRKIQKKYKLKDAPLYSYRHTGASLLIAAGCDVKEVSAHLGHSRASTTLDKYSHLFEKASQHTSDVMTAALYKARQMDTEPPEPLQMKAK